MITITQCHDNTTTHVNYVLGLVYWHVCGESKSDNYYLLWGKWMGLGLGLGGK
jgi:hypothetical protein